MNSLIDHLIYGDYQKLSSLLEKASSVVILTDENTTEYCLPVLLEKIESPFLHIEVPPGEKHKNLDTVQSICRQLTEHHIDRKAVIIHLGGGVITDMGGFCASIYKRGVKYIQVPTTLLSMVDAAIGGKNGVDFMGHKNLLGIIRSPKAVFINASFLSTLPRKEILSGAAEIIKAALIHDPDLWAEIRQTVELDAYCTTRIIQRAIQIKQQIVTKDPYEKGLRKILNFGHTIGHAIEAYFLSEGQPITHGAAVAAGIYYEAILSHRYFKLSNQNMEIITGFLQKHYSIPRFSPEEIRILIRHMQQDKKNDRNTILGVLLADIGVPAWDQIYTTDMIEAILNEV